MLPGRLTTKHIEAAIARGDGYIEYRGRVFSIAELKELDEVGQWSRRTEKKAAAGRAGVENGSGNRVANRGERSDKAHAEETHPGEELTEIGSQGTPE